MPGAKHLPTGDPALHTALVRLSQAVRRAIDDDPEVIPREVRVYYQALGYVAAVLAPAAEATGPAAVTDEQRQAAAAIDARVRRLRRQGYDDIMLFVQMAEGEEMARFKWLLDTTTAEGLDELCEQFEDFSHYAQLLERIAGGIASGEIPVPR